MNRIVALSLLSILLSACAGRAVQLDQRHVETVIARVASADQNCRIGPTQFSDRRPHAQLGTLGGHSLTYDELLAWVQESLRASIAEDPALPALRVELARAYFESHPSGHSFQLVLRAAEAEADNPPWRIYRGIDSGITWWGNDGEYGHYVETAGARALQALISAEARCSSP